MHKTAMADAKRFVDKYLEKNQSYSIAEIGSYNVNGSIRPHFSNENWFYLGFDIVSGPDVDIVIPESNWPQEYHNKFDVVVSSQVMEHVKRPWSWMRDVASFCKPGGIIYICTPNTISYHPHPIDCWRVWPEGMRACMEDAMLTIVEVYASNIDTSGIAKKQDTTDPSEIKFKSRKQVMMF